MAGFLDGWRKPSRLLQDVKTKSIERTLLPLIKQVSKLHRKTNSSSSGKCSEESYEFFSCKFSYFVSFNFCGTENWMESENSSCFFLWMRWWWEIILVFVGFYFKNDIFCDVSKLYCGFWAAWKGFLNERERKRFTMFCLYKTTLISAHSSYHKSRFLFPSTIQRSSQRNMMKNLL